MKVDQRCQQKKSKGLRFREREDHATSPESSIHLPDYVAWRSFRTVMGKCGCRREMDSAPLCMNQMFCWTVASTP
ncbi:hypothetical protein CEXT_460491 [Caerostris extrusa]|uniref:Uncharacterized protein n=1 Tax=Caerostris extrusa TaxID=172846 RepID=A0AAV4NPG8_CAEEX|nr:hypothetical protein CEXT_460491 [Caerostris extrusa]